MTKRWYWKGYFGFLKHKLILLEDYLNAMETFIDTQYKAIVTKFEEEISKSTDEERDGLDYAQAVETEGVMV